MIPPELLRGLKQQVEPMQLAGNGISFQTEAALRALDNEYRKQEAPPPQEPLYQGGGSTAHLMAPAQYEALIRAVMGSRGVPYPQAKAMVDVNMQATGRRLR